MINEEELKDFINWYSSKSDDDMTIINDYKKYKNNREELKEFIDWYTPNYIDKNFVFTKYKEYKNKNDFLKIDNEVYNRLVNEFGKKLAFLWCNIFNLNRWRMLLMNLDTKL